MISRKEYRQQWYIENKSRAQLVNRINHLKTKFNLSLDDYENMLQNQNNVCAICRRPETAINHRSKKIKLLAVDHCHITKKVRKLLCQKCNHMLGACEENILTLENMINYIKEHKNAF